MPGALLLAIPAAAAIVYSLLHYSLWSFGMPGSGLMPLVGGAIVLFACGVIAIIERSGMPLPQLGLAPVAYMMAFILQLLLSGPLGLLPALAIISIVLLRFVERMSVMHSVMVGVLVSGGSWLLFQRLLMVPLPEGWIWSF